MINAKTKYQKLALNSILFAVGNFGSRLISFIMLPLYTFALSPGEFGISDLLLTTISLLLPIISFNIFEAVLRFGMDESINNKAVITNGLIVSFVNSGVLLLLLPIFNVFDIQYSGFIVAILIVQLFQSLLSQFAKSENEIKLYAVNGMLLSFLLALSNFILLVYFKLGISGYLWSILIANFISNVYLSRKMKIREAIDLKLRNFLLIKEMLKYSVPLVPNSIALWVSNTASRYFILYFLGSTMNGIFAVANKIPTLLGVLNTIFFQSWQMTAIEEFESNEKSEFYSKIFNMFAKLLFFCSTIIIFFLKPTLYFVVSNDFFESWRYVPFLLLSVIYSSFSGFLGTNYIAAKQTKGAFYTTIVGATINTILNFILIPTLGLSGAGISSAVSFFCLWMIRSKDTQKYVQVRLDLNVFIINHLIFFIQIVCLFLLNGINMYLIQGILVVMSLLYNKEVSLEIVKKVVLKFQAR